MVINIRGTGGSGKSTVVKRIMALYSARTPYYIEGRKQPLYTVCIHPRVGELELLVPGHYNVACGGCDTLKGPQHVYDIIKEFGTNMHRHVLFEGIMVGDDVKRAVDLHLSDRGQFQVIVLSTPVDECLRSIEARRAEKGNEKPLDPANTIDRDKRLRKSMVPRLKDSGVPVFSLDREAAFQHVRGAFGL